MKNIRRAEEKDAARINELLHQVQNVHAVGRPDIFIYGAKKYTDDELMTLIGDDERPIFVAVDEDDIVLGYAFCIYETVAKIGNLKDMKTLYIDDLCVDENVRGKHIGTKLFEYVKMVAKEKNCYRITLNVWNLNKSAMAFYEKCGLKPLKVTMEDIL